MWCFAVLFRARLQARLQADDALGPFSLHQIKQRNFEAEIHKRFAARSARGRHAANSDVMHSRLPPQRLRLSPPLWKQSRQGP